MHLSNFINGLTKRCGPIHALLPTNLSIVDCFFLGKAFVNLRVGAPAVLLASDGQEQSELWSSAEDPIEIAYKIYGFDRKSGLLDWALVDFQSRCFVLWDAHDRFVGIGGSEAFLRDAIPYPREIQRHFFIEGMAGTISQEEAAEVLDGLTAR